MAIFKGVIKTTIKDKLKKLRQLMSDRKIDMYIIPTADFHQSEYVGEHFKVRKYMTGFTGSAGTALITMSDAYLWTDGRYFLQAEKQLDPSCVKLMKSGEPGVPSLEEFLRQNLPSGGTIGYDGRVVPVSDGKVYESVAKEKGGQISYTFDLAGDVWEDRPPLSEEPVFELDVEYAGEERSSKLARIRQAMAAEKADLHVLTTLDDICWTLNIRGNDIEFFPLVLAYAVIGMEKVTLYTDSKKYSDLLKKRLMKDGVEFKAYDSIYEDVKSIGKHSKILIDPARLNYALYQNLPSETVKIEKTNPEIFFKAVKNEVEIANMRKAQIKDSIAHIKFMKWVKETYDKETVTELSASHKLDKLREEQGGFIRPSFEPIVSFGEHGAIVHYTSSPETDVALKGGSFLLTDTGAGFYEGSTDITRTYALGTVSDEMKKHFTLVAISNLRLANAEFLYGTTGMTLDMLAREPFWNNHLNFNHGTGHGVGYLLNIHEPPTGFRWQYRPGEIYPFQAGMIITDEPGIYLEGKYGIRLENELLARNGEKNEYGQFMYFEPITYIPFDLDAIDASVMTEEDRKLLNHYHTMVYEKISPYLDKEEKEWLELYTRAI